MGNWLWGSTEGAAEREPWCLQHHKLEQWYNENIQRGTTQFDKDCRVAVDTVVKYVHRVCSKNKDLFDVSKVIKGGSLGKRTMVKDLSDVDLVAFINSPHMTSLGPTPPQVYRDKLKVVLAELREALGGHPLVRINKIDSYLVNFAVKVRSDVGEHRWIEVDLLPTADNIRTLEPLQVVMEMYSNQALDTDPLFRKMLKMSNYDRGFYSASLVELQRDFVKDQPGYIKELIRLVKYWAYTCLPLALRKSYSLELITIHRWENAGSPSSFQKAQGLKDVFEILTDLSQLRKYWLNNYDIALAELSIVKLRFTNPIVLDPANPTNNVCLVYQPPDNRKEIKDAAWNSLQSSLLRDVEVTSNWSG